MTEHNPTPAAAEEADVQDQVPVVEEAAEVSTHEESDATQPAEETEESFGKPYVDKLRKESAGYRERAKTAENKAEELARRLHSTLVEMDGRLADPEDLPFSPDHLEDSELLTTAITELVSKKPGLRARRAIGDVGQGKRGSEVTNIGLIDLIRGS